MKLEADKRVLTATTKIIQAMRKNAAVKASTGDVLPMFSGDATGTHTSLILSTQDRFFCPSLAPLCCYCRTPVHWRNPHDCTELTFGRGLTLVRCPMCVNIDNEFKESLTRWGMNFSSDI